jgi:hypothetical protein
MADTRILAALDLPEHATPDQIARKLRPLVGLSVGGSTDSEMWERFVDGFETARRMQPGPVADAGEMAHWVVEHAFVPAGFADEERFGDAAWDREFAGIGAFEANERLRMLVIEEIGPLLVKAGLYSHLS